MNSPKFLFICQNGNYSSGGEAVAIQHFARELFYKGYDVELFSLSEISINDEIYKTGINYCKKSYLKFLFDLVKISRLLHKPLIVIHGVWHFALWPIFLVVNFTNIKYYIFPHGSFQPNSLMKRRYIKFLVSIFIVNSAIKNAERIIAISNMEYECLKNKFNKAKVVNIGVGVPFHQAKESPVSRNFHNTLLYVGRVERQKGIECLLDALKMISNQSWRLLVIGAYDLSYLDFLKSRLIEYGINNKIIFMGPLSQEKVFRFYQKSNVLVHPSFSENFGFSIAEAMLCGLPVITTDSTPWAQDSLESGCVIVKTGDAHSLAQAISKMLSLDQLSRDLIGINSKNYVKKNFSWTTATSKFINFI